MVYQEYFDQIMLTEKVSGILLDVFKEGSRADFALVHQNLEGAVGINDQCIKMALFTVDPVFSLQS